MKLHTHQRNLILLNVILGIAVLGSYTIAFGQTPEVRGALWGRVPQALLPVYTVCMFMAAFGYFTFSLFLLFRTDPDRTFFLNGKPYTVLYLLYTLMLLPSALWMPLTVQMIVEPSLLKWIAVRTVLFLVALGSAGILAAVITTTGREHAWGRRLAILGALLFCLQTVVLDAFIWPYYFPLNL